MRVLQVCAEMFPLLKTGGLADVSGALPGALMALPSNDGSEAPPCDVRVLLPGFEAILAGLSEVAVVAELPPHFGAEGLRLLHGQTAQGVSVYAIDAPSLYLRAGGPYAGVDQQPFGDNHRRFALLGWMAARLADGLDPAWRPAVVHAHDWHAALAPAYVRAHGAPVGTVFTVHNLAYQGCFAGHHFGELELPGEMFGMHGMEYHGQVSFMKAGLYFADRLTTVSPTYAREITGPEQGCGLDGLLRDRLPSLSGILNGVDDAVWNPANDTLLPANYRLGNLKGKAECKRVLRAELGLDENAEGPLFCVVSRITEQKGLHLVLQVVEDIVARGGQFALIGSGDSGMEAAFLGLAQAHPSAVSVRIGYDEAYAHRLIAGSDVILVPSRFEPCGLTQLYGLKYGSLPLVRRVGGLADTVVDTTLETLDENATGFAFDAFDAPALRGALHRAWALWRRPAEWKRVQKRGMQQAFGWSEAAQRYLALYGEVAPATP